MKKSILLRESKWKPQLNTVAGCPYIILLNSWNSFKQCANCSSCVFVSFNNAPLRWGTQMGETKLDGSHSVGFDEDPSQGSN